MMMVMAKTIMTKMIKTKIYDNDDDDDKENQRETKIMNHNNNQMLSHRQCQLHSSLLQHNGVRVNLLKIIMVRHWLSFIITCVFTFLLWSEYKKTLIVCVYIITMVRICQDIHYHLKILCIMIVYLLWLFLKYYVPITH